MIITLISGYRTILNFCNFVRFNADKIRGDKFLNFFEFLGVKTVNLLWN